MASKKKSRSVTRKGISGKSKTKDDAVKDSKVKELPLKDQIGRKVGHFDKSKRGEKSAVKKSEAGGRTEMTKGKTNYKKNVTEEREIKNFETPMKRKRGADGEIVQAFILSVDKGSSRLRPRKEVPVFKMVDLADEDSERIIGKRVKVYWSGSRKWFTGRVKAFDNKKMVHTIYYEDGDTEDLNLSRERFQLEVMPGENFTLKLEPKSEKKVKGSYDGMVIAEFLKINSAEEGNSKLNKDSEPMKKEAPKIALRRGSSKPKWKDAEVRKTADLVKEMDVDMIHEDADELKNDEVRDVEGCEVPEFKMVDLADEDCERIIGKRTKVYWSGSRKWFPGRVIAFDNKKMLHTIYYEDGDKEDLNLRRERFQLEVMPSENFTLKLESKSEKKVKGSYDGMVIAEFLKINSNKEGNSKLKKDSETMKKEAPKNALGKGRSKSKRKDAEVRKAEDLVIEKDVDTIHEDVDELKNDEVRDVEGCEVPEFKMVDLADEDSARIIGKRVKVYWSGSRKWFPGRVKAFDDKKMLHTIYYEDGDKEALNLRRERFQLEVMPSENFTLKLESKSEKKYDGMVIADFLKINSNKEGNSKPKKDSETMKKEAPKNTLRRGRSKPKRKDAEVRKAEDLVIEMDVDMIDVDELKNGEVQDVEGCEVPEFKMVDLADEDSERIIGKRVKVYWSGSRKWFPGCVKAFDNKKMLHTIYYEDGDKEDLNLSRERFQLEVMPGENFTLKLEPKSEKKVKGSYDDMVIAEFFKSNSNKEGNSKLKKDSETMKKEAPKNALRMGSSKPKWKDAEVRKAEDLVIEMDVDMIHEDADELKNDEVQNVEGCETDHIESKSLLYQASRLKSNSETRDMGSDKGEEDKKSVKGSSVKEGDAQRQKKHVKSNKKAAPTTRAATLKHSKTQLKEESNKEGKLLASVEFDGNQVEVEPDRMHLETNLEESSDLSFPKEKELAKSTTRESSPGNGGTSQEAEASQSNLNSDDNEFGLDGSKLSKVAGDDRSTSPYSAEDITEDLVARVEVYVHPIKVGKKVEGGEIEVEGTMVVNSLENNAGEVTFSQAVNEGTCKQSLNLQSTEPESLEEDEEDPEILRDKLKIINREFARDIAKEALVGSVSEGTMETSTQGPNQPADIQNENCTMASALAIQNIFVRRARTKVERR